MEKLPILLLEDDFGISELIKFQLEELDYEIVHYTKGIKALEWLENNKTTLIILDNTLEDMNGIEFLLKLKESCDKLPFFIVTTGDEDERLVASMLKLGAINYIIKDINFIEVIKNVVTKFIQSTYSHDDLK